MSDSSTERGAAAEAEADQRVVVGIDGSPGSLAALQWAAEAARHRGVPLHVLFAWDDLGTHLAKTTRENKKPTEEEEREAALGLIEKAVREALGAEPGVEIVPCPERGEPTPALLAASKTADLLVVGSRGRGGFAGLLLGSVSQHCIQHAHCPVAVIRHQAAD
ncbi:MAG: universal stress protein [Acidimicrobiales bacterium]|nr:universal stress protein [Acidimicrobiales bacterium]